MSPPKPTRAPGNAKSERSLAALSQAVLLLLERKAFEDITIRELVDEAGIGQATFYRHYPDKTALLDAVASREIDALVQLALSMLDARSGQRGAYALVAHIDAHRRLWSVLLRGGAAARMRSDLLARLAARVGEMPSNELGWLPPELGIAFAATATIEILVWWLSQDTPVPLGTVAEYLDRLAIAPTLRREPALGPGTFVLEVEGTVRIVSGD